MNDRIYRDYPTLARECIGKQYIPRGPRDFPRLGILHPESQEIAALGRKIPTLGKSLGPLGDVFPNASLLLAVYGYNIPS